MYSTHYMDLLMQNSPWNLILFMAIPVILAEAAVIAELWIPHANNAVNENRLRLINRLGGSLCGLAFVFIEIYLITTVFIPLTVSGDWRTWVDFLAVTSYLLAGIPMILLGLMNARVLWRKAIKQSRDKISMILLASFLVLAHVAMIFGMVDPGVAGYTPKQGTAQIHQHTPTVPHQMPAGSMENQDHDDHSHHY